MTAVSCSSLRIGTYSSPSSGTACALGDAVEAGLAQCLRHRGQFGRVRGPDLQGAAADLGLQLVDAAAGDDPALVDDGELVGELLGLFHVLGGEQHGRPLRDHALHLVPDLVTGTGVEPCRRLVQIEDGRAADHGGGEVQPAAHSAGVLHRGLLRRVREREALQQLVGARAGLLARQVEQPPDHVEVLPAGELLVDRGVLPGQADGAAQRAGLLHHVEARHDGVSGVGLDQGGQDSYEGGLAGAVGAEHAEDGALAHIEVHAVQSLGLAVVLDQPPYLDGVVAVPGVLVDSRHVHHQTSRHRQRTDRPPTAGRQPADGGCRRAVGGAAVVVRSTTSGTCAPAPGRCRRRPRPRTPSRRRRGSGAGRRTAW